jgi:soluble lytic murein transglycosylase
MGLMQLVPRTAQRIHASPTFPKAPKTAGLDFRAGSEALFVPNVNVSLGGWYVGELSKRFHAQIPLVGAAYNAGPAEVIKWIGTAKTMDTDEFVERIPFREARQYVKRLLETRVIYGLLYEEVGLAKAAEWVPLHLDLTVRPGVAF